jgi:hypothetical protein
MPPASDSICQMANLKTLFPIPDLRKQIASEMALTLFPHFVSDCYGKAKSNRLPPGRAGTDGFVFSQKPLNQGLRF